MNNDILKIYQSIGSNQNINATSPSRNDNFDSAENRNFIGSEIPNKKEIEEILNKIPAKASNSRLPFSNEIQRNYYELQNQNSQSHSQNDGLPENYLKRKREKSSKGLRHFSMKVCEKVKQKTVTTYNEVADELVHEYCNFPGEHSLVDYWSYDQKNVRRRVYDALNVLMAMRIISKEKKEIKWIGLPCNKKQECQELEEDIKRMNNVIKQKREQLKNLISEHTAYKMLIEKNMYKENKKAIIKTPFIIIETDRKTTIDCNISNDKKDYILYFDNTFKINAHSHIFNKMGLTMNIGDSLNESRLGLMLPKIFKFYLMANSNMLVSDPLINLQNYKNLIKFEKNKNDQLDESLDEAAEYSGDSDQLDGFISDENSLIDSSN